MAATHAAELLEGEAEAALAEAHAIARSASWKLVDGDPATVLLKQAETEHGTLIAVGSHGRRRVPGLLLGTVAARMLRDATCSVLVARAARDSEAWPGAIVVGVDGSAESAAAFTIARSGIGRPRRRGQSRVARAQGARERERASRAPGALVRARCPSRSRVISGGVDALASVRSADFISYGDRR
jgi:hypothetical protein